MARPQLNWFPEDIERSEVWAGHAIGEIGVYKIAQVAIELFTASFRCKHCGLSVDIATRVSGRDAYKACTRHYYGGTR